MHPILLIFILLMAIFSLVFFVFIKFIMEAKKTLLTEQIAWSAKSLKITRKEKSIENELNKGNRSNKLLEEIADQSADFLKKQ